MGCCVACVGWLAIVYLAVRFALALYNILYPFIIAKKFGLLRNLRSFGTWAVVTGATDGIGKAYAELLAKRGFNVVLIGRNPEKLLSTSADIAKVNSAVEIKTVVADLGSSDLSLYDNIGETLRNLDIGVLVNNVGVGYDHPEYFLEVPGGRNAIANMLNVNCLAGTMMCWTVLPGMVERKRGAIINVSSFAGTYPGALLSVYSASKAYLDYFSKGLNQEYKSKGIIVQSVAPLFVATKLSGIRHESFMIPGPRTYVSEALDTIGLQSFTLGCLAHTIQYSVVSLLPTCVKMALSQMYMKSIRQRALKKKERGSQKRD